jgi:hypothetical protein
VDDKLFDLKNDPYDIHKGRLRKAHERRDKEIDDMAIDRASMYAYIMSKISKESRDEVARVEKWKEIEAERDPLRLWLAIRESHQTCSTSKVASVIKKSAREEYSACKQGIYESIVDFKSRFDARLEAYKASGNTAISDEDVATDFLYALDNSRYDEFKAEIVNDIQKNVMKQPKTLNDVYLLASRRVIIRKNHTTMGGATFATVEESLSKRNKKNVKNGKNGNDKADDGSDAHGTGGKSRRKFKCYNCYEEGHIAKNCPLNHEDEEEGDDDEPPMAGMTYKVCCSTGKGGRLHEFYEVCIDNGSQVNIVDPRLLTMLRTEHHPYRSMNGKSTTSRVGHLDGFFECQACDTCPANILSQADVEDLYPVTYRQGESITVHMDDRDVVFVRREKMYVADFSDWIIEDEVRVNEVSSGLCLLTVEELESQYTRKEVRKALEAGEFLRALGYPSEKEAVHIVQDGNVMNVPYTAADVRRFYDIYGAQVAALRGKTTRQHAVQVAVEDRELREQRTRQVLVSDVMHACGHKFLVTLCSPLELTVISNVANQSKETMGTAMQGQINLLRSKGFEPEQMHVDPHKTLVSLDGAFPGIPMDISGAGDHLDKIDSKTRRIKETMRSVIAGLPYKLHSDRGKDLATYAVHRMNTRRTEALPDNVCPRVKFTGVKPDFKKEFGLAFGDYVEAYNPRAAERSNDVEQPRTEPCIALYPSGNKNGSWMLWNIHTKTYVRRTQWKKLPTSQIVIDCMNAAAEGRELTTADLIDGAATEGPDAERPVQEKHDPADFPGVDIGITMDALALGDDVDDVPELGHYPNDDEDEYDEDPDEDMPDLVGKITEDRSNGLVGIGDGNESSESIESNEERAIPRRSTRATAGVRRYDENYQWNLMNLSVKTAVADFGEVADAACEAELVQLFREKRALVPVIWDDLTKEQQDKVVRSHMFLKEKFEDGIFQKLKARIVADGRTQDRNTYPDYSSPTVKTRSIMTCLKVAAMKGMKAMKIDVGGAFLCAKIDETEEVFMTLDRQLTSMAVKYMPALSDFVRSDGALVVRLERAMYGLIQSAKLWYKELTEFLKTLGFRITPSDECVLHLKRERGRDVMILLYVDDLLVLAQDERDLDWVKGAVEKKYEKVTYERSDRMSYLGMVLEETPEGFEISMTSYIEAVLEFYGDKVKECITPAKSDLFTIDESADVAADRTKFHAIVAKLLYLGKRGRPDILLAVQFLCTRVKQPTVQDGRKLARVLGYLQLTKLWKRKISRDKFERVEIYIDASFALHQDGKSQSGCCVMLGGTLVHEACRKQKLVTKDSTEAELVAVSDYLIEGELVEEFLMDLGVEFDEDIVTNVLLVHQDNTSTISLVTKGGGKPRSKYMKVRIEHVKERLGTSEVEIVYTPTKSMIADILTKPLSGELFHNLVRLLLDNVAKCSAHRGAKSIESRQQSRAKSIESRQQSPMTPMTDDALVRRTKRERTE